MSPLAQMLLYASFDVKADDRDKRRGSSHHEPQPVHRPAIAPGKRNRAFRDYAHVQPPSASSSGEPLPANLRARLEGSLGHDLGSVRVHTGAQSAAASEALAARAYTQDQDIFFGAGQYDPSSTEGQHLIAHEVAHTVQQRGVTGAATHRKVIDPIGAAMFGGLLSQPGDASERQADAFADAFVSGSARAVTVTPGSAAPGIVARKPKATGKPVMIISAWDENLQRLKVWNGRTEWSGALRTYRGRVRDGQVRWRGQRPRAGLLGHE